MELEYVFHNIRAECARIDLSITRFCEEIGVSRKTWYLWMEKGDLPTSALVKAARRLRISTDTLLELSFGN